MNEIFSAATKVVVWLGGDPEIPSDILPEHDRSLDVLADVLRGLGLSSLPVPNLSDLEAIEHAIMLREGAGYDLESIMAHARDTWPRDGRFRQCPISTYAVDIYILSLCKKTVGLRTMELRFLGCLLDPTLYVWQFYRYFIIEAAIFFGKRRVVEALSPEEGVADSEEISLPGHVPQLVSIPWFERVWVVQEVAGNENVSVRHGKSMLAWEIIALCCASFATVHPRHLALSERQRLGLEDFDFARSVRLARFWGMVTSRRLPISALLLASSSLRATVPRDKIYAIYRLAADLPDISFKPDYIHPLQATYTDFTHGIIAATRRLDIISLPSLAGTQAICSWVPQYHRLPSSAFSSLLPRIHRFDSAYRTSGDRPTCYIKPARNRSIILQGVHLATVMCCFAPVAPRSFCDIWNTLASVHHSAFGPRMTTDDVQWDDHLFSVEAFTAASRSFIELLTLTSLDGRRKVATDIFLSAMKLHDATGMRLSHLSVEDIWALRRCDTSSWKQSVIPSYGGLVVQLSTFLSYFFTADGTIGGCSQAVQEGDLVVALDGGSRPFVLRRRFSPSHDRRCAEAVKGGMEFQLIGTCYLHGAMDGKIFDSPRWRESDPLYVDPMDYDPDLRTPGGTGYTKGFYRKRPFVIT
ncbi:hypothetical protein CLCR_03374 [Cladophialophora carrionii]|uniref:Heterokaryon incompatibility domain-containing protein n=1 Tax=Cladophialophora carrionii TaxID=86049 RepID=A0A1C1CGT4_9EURO|nr:hypothetical protein CLCR_03374 [Cladophialophora carrionii]